MPFVIIGFILMAILLTVRSLKKDKREEEKRRQTPVFSASPDPIPVIAQQQKPVPRPVIMSYSQFLKKHARRYVAFDLETTGLSPQNDAIVEIGAVKVENGRVTDTFSTFVNPRRPIPEAATAIHHITDQMVENAPDPGAALADFQAFVGNLPCVAHNCSFDASFLAAAGLSPLPSFADSLAMARSLLPGLPNYKLGAVCAAIDHEICEAHRALDDAKAVCAIIQSCAPLLAEAEAGKKALERHDQLSMAIRNAYSVARSSEEGKEEQLRGVLAMCREDFTLVEPVRAYCALKGYPEPVFDSFRRAIIILGRQKEYEKAADVCRQALELGVEDPQYPGGMAGRLEKLKAKC